MNWVIQDLPCLTQSIACLAIGFFAAILIGSWRKKKKEDEGEKQDVK